MGAMVSPDSLAVAVQLPAQLRGPGLYSDHVVGGITVGLQRLRSLPHPVESDGHAALGVRSQRDGRVDGYSWHRWSHPADFRTPSSCCTTPPSPCSPWCSRPSGSASPGSTMVAVVYAALSLVMEPGVDFEIKEEKVLFTRVVIMYAVVAAVNLVSRFERIRRREAVERER